MLGTGEGDMEFSTLIRSRGGIACTVLQKFETETMGAYYLHRLPGWKTCT